MSKTSPIFIISEHLDYGGIERFVVNLANAFCQTHPVEIICVYKKSKTPAFPLDPKIKVTYVFEYGLVPNRAKLINFIKKLQIIKAIPEIIASIYILYRRHFTLRKYIKSIKNGVIITASPVYNKLLSNYGADTVTKIASEHNHLLSNKKHTHKVIRSCSRVDFLVLPSSEIYDFYQTKLSSAKAILIPHFLSHLPTETSPSTSLKIISAARLSAEKGFLDMIDVFAKIVQKIPDTSLEIMGEGEQRIFIEEKIETLDLSKKVTLPGNCNDTYIAEAFNSSSIYLVTSHSESFGLAPLEALSYAVPVIAFDTARGLLDFVRNEQNGYIIKNRDIELMAQKCIKLLKDKPLRFKFSERARLSAQNYTQIEILKQWEKLITSR